MKNIKIENTRKILGVGNVSVEIEDQEKHFFHSRCQKQG